MKLLTRVLISIGVLLCMVSSSVLAQESSLPAQYDLRDLNGVNYVSPVKNQGGFGTCWAHGAISAAETSSMLKGGSSSVNLSEKALAWFAYHLQGSKSMSSGEYEGVDLTDFDVTWQYEGSSRVYSTGGIPTAAMSQMCTWNGASTEAQIPYLNSNKEYLTSTTQGAVASPFGDWELPYSDIYDDAYHLQNCEMLLGPALNHISAADFTNEAKELILKYGALTLAYTGIADENQYYNATTASQYCDQRGGGTHVVCIVGWNDNYPASNFNITPPGDGAWIVKNSWGESWGDNGYFYLSYYDQTINVVQGLDVETEQSGFSYDKNNQYDFHNVKGNYASTAIREFSNMYNLSSLPEGAIKMANVFTSSNDETLRAVSACPIVDGSSKVTASVYLLNENYSSPEDGQLVATVTENFDHKGFYTLELDTPIEMAAGTQYSVVEELTYYNAQFPDSKTGYLTEPIPSMPALAIEFGMEEPILSDMRDDKGNQIGYTFEQNTVTCEPGQSYVYGLNGSIGSTPPVWMDVTNPEILNKLSLTVPLAGPNGTEVENTVTPGNVMIKAYTTYGIGDDIINPSSVTLSNESLYLSTVDGGRNVRPLVAIVEPANSTTNLTWSVSPSNIVSLQPNGKTAMLTALNEGVATVTLTTGNDLVATSTIIVSNDELICDGLDIIQNTPDMFSVILRNLTTNPAVPNAQNAQRVSLFMWSERNQGDMDARLMNQIPGTNDWISEAVPVNQTELHNYFINASDIYVHVYASSDQNSDGNMITTGQVQWVTPGTVYDSSVAYIAYCQNMGFVRPTVWNGKVSGQIDNPDSVHMEGFRISSGMLGIEFNSSAYAQGLGWLPEVGDGSYVGTMGQNRALESINLSLEASIPDLDKLLELQYRVYVKDVGWTDWVGPGQDAGTPGSGKPIQALQVTLTPIEIEFN